MKKYLIVFAVLVFITAAACTAFAFEKHCGKQEGPQGMDKDNMGMKTHMILKNQDELGLSDEQVKKIKEIQLKSEKDEIMKNAEIETVAVDLRSQMMEDTLNLETINALIDKKFEIKKAKAKAEAAVCAELKGILTAEQKTKLKEIHKEHKPEKGTKQK